MSDKKSDDKKPVAKPPLQPMPRRRRPGRALLASFILMLVIAAYQFHTEGYGVLIGSARDDAQDESKLVRLSCTYFTGTEKVITHVMRLVTDEKSKASCGFFTKLPKLNTDPYTIIPGEKVIPIGPKKDAPPQAPAAPADAPKSEAPPPETPKP